MTNDTSTLQGSLYECKDQLISELANQGVTATYDPTTGLLGLIAHIADIQGGEAILLTTDKNILSYADSETATLTATHSRGAGKSVSVYNAVSGAKIGDMTDEGDGTYTYTYTSAGVGDISMTATSGTTESNSIPIEDCLFYADTTKISSWTTSGIIRYSNYTIPDNSSVTWKFSNNLNNIRVGIGNGDGQYVTVWYKNPSSYQTHRYTYMYYTTSQTLKETVTNITTDDTVTVKLQGSTATWYKNDVQQDTGSISTTLTRNVRLVDYTSYTVEYVKVKPLTTS